jgi:beta-1,4-mannosyltransferase
MPCHQNDLHGDILVYEGLSQLKKVSSLTMHGLFLSIDLLNSGGMKILAFPAFANKTVNPYNALLYDHAAKHGADAADYTHLAALAGSYDVLHYHWPDGYINVPGRFKMLQRVAVLMGVVMLAKARGKKIVWTVHNLSPHDAHHPKEAAWVLSWFARQCDGLIFLTEGGRLEFTALYGSVAAKKIVIPHGHYRPIYPRVPSKVQARQVLGLPIDKTVILSFGLIKPYKNIDGLIDAFEQIKDPNTLLLIAGNCSDQTLASALKAKVKSNSSIRLDMKFIDDAQVPAYFAASDLMVLPYKQILNFGALLLSLSFNVSVLAPRRGSFRDVQTAVGAQWLSLYDGDFDGSVLRPALIAAKSIQDGAVCDMSAFDWDQIGQRMVTFYKSL